MKGLSSWLIWYLHDLDKRARSIERGYSTMKVAFEREIQILKVSLAVSPAWTSTALMSLLAPHHICHTYLQQALETERSNSANKVMRVCDPNQGGADTQQSWLIALFDQNRFIVTITKMVLVDLFCSNAQHIKGHFSSQLVLRSVC